MHRIGVLDGQFYAWCQVLGKARCFGLAYADLSDFWNQGVRHNG